MKPSNSLENFDYRVECDDFFLYELGRLIEYHPSIGSTQDRARELAGFGDRAPTLIVADQQTGGHGRGEKSWLSEPGGSGAADSGCPSAILKR